MDLVINCDLVARVILGTRVVFVTRGLCALRFTIAIVILFRPFVVAARGAVVRLVSLCFLGRSRRNGNVLTVRNIKALSFASFVANNDFFRFFEFEIDDNCFLTLNRNFLVRIVIAVGILRPPPSTGVRRAKKKVKQKRCYNFF